MDVILIQPRGSLGARTLRRVPLPLGLLSVATPLDVAGYKVEIIDQRTEPHWERSLLAALETKPLCLGVTSMGGPQIWWALEASRIVKENSDVPVVWGGVHPNFLPRQTLENPYVDIVVQGEGEETFFELVRALAGKRSLEGVNGVWYKDGGRIKQNPPRPFIDLNRQPPLSYQLVDLKTHTVSVAGRDAFLFETSRGCAFNCSFCYTTTFHRRQWRSLTVDETLSRMQRIVGEYGINGIVFSDDNFFGSMERANRILDEIVQRKLDISWGRRYIRLDAASRLDDDYLRLIRRSGCMSLVVGVESGSQRVADILRKEMDVSQAVAVNRRLAGHDMLLRYLFLVGVPGETEEDLDETTSLIVRLVEENPKAAAVANIFVPFPGNDLFDVCTGYGLREPQKLEEWIPVSFDNRSLDYPWLSDERKKLLRALAFCTDFLAKGSSVDHADVPPLLSLAARLYRPVAVRRLRGRRYGFMPEMKAAQLLGYGGFSLGL